MISPVFAKAAVAALTPRLNRGARDGRIVLGCPAESTPRPLHEQPARESQSSWFLRGTVTRTLLSRYSVTRVAALILDMHKYEHRARCR